MIMGSGITSGILDVPGVRVAHVNVRDDARKIRTGVTCVYPGEGHPFRMKYPAGCHVINGFGKSLGLMQVAELGMLETPILLTNTLSVGRAFAACVRHMLNITPEIGDTTGTVNPVVFECADSTISDLRSLAVTEEHALAAIAKAEAGICDTPLLGGVGAGSGMTCYGLKGGFGSSSRIIRLYDNEYTLGCLALTNFGAMRRLTIRGDYVGGRLCEVIKQPIKPPVKPDTEKRDAEKGSVIILYATDAPLSSRQLTRICGRAQSGIARTGTYTGNGSGEIALAFSTANRIPHADPGKIYTTNSVHDSQIDLFFEAAVDAAEDAVLSSLEHGETTPARNGGYIYGLREALSMAEHV